MFLFIESECCETEQVVDPLRVKRDGNNGIVNNNDDDVDHDNDDLFLFIE